MVLGVPHPAWFVVGAVVLVVWVVLIVVGAARADRADRARELVDLLVPERVPCPRVGDPASRHVGPRRDRQLLAQERAARAALRCQGGRVDVAPVRCPVRDEDRLS